MRPPKLHSHSTLLFKISKSCSRTLLPSTSALYVLNALLLSRRKSSVKHSCPGGRQKVQLESKVTTGAYFHVPKRLLSRYAIPLINSTSCCRTFLTDVNVPSHSKPICRCKIGFSSDITFVFLGFRLASHTANESFERACCLLASVYCF